jgi:glutamyl-tRNA synthetase
VRIRTRFAPSPTGFLHIGGARTALYSWLCARHAGGATVLRIEDTDRERSTEAAVQAILDSIAWLRLDHDEGPYYQTQRFDRYREVVARLLEQGKAYHCYCTREELEQMREAQMARKEKPRYDGRCRNGRTPVPDVPPVVRFKNPQEGAVIVDDLVRGRVVFDNAELDDLIIARSDGTPTYNFCVVVDDLDMRITHVIRGDDHLNNTPRQMNIIAALGGTPPAYGHLPMILGADGAKLSKRHAAVGVMEYREAGYLPEALLNYLVRLGWAHGDQEIFSREEMIEYFDVSDINKSASRFDPDKLAWLNQHYIKTGDPQRLAAELQWHFDRLGISTAGGPPLDGVVRAQQERAATLHAMAQASTFFYADFDAYDEKAAKKHLASEAAPALRQVREALAALSAWRAADIHTAINAIAETLGQGLGKVAQPVRVAVAGGSVSPPIDVTLELLGRERSLARLDRALAYIAASK